MKRAGLVAGAIAAAIAAAVALVARGGPARETRGASPNAGGVEHYTGGARHDADDMSSGRIRLAVLGDSDSHGYRDNVLGTRRGGAYHETTLQWTDVLARARGDYFDLGEEGVWGSRGVIARVRAAVGLEAKTPRKFDYRWNYAVSGARCTTLLHEWPWQVRWLESALRHEPAAWANGLVVIRIGVNDVGLSSHMERYAEHGVTPGDRARIARCAEEIGAAARAIRKSHASVRIVVVGVADDSSWPVGIVPDRDAVQVAHIREALDLFDASVRNATEHVPGAVFMEDRSWYRSSWPDRDASGRAVLGARNLGGTVPITNTRGDEPHHPRR